MRRALRAAGLRAETDLRNEKVDYKVREHSLAKVPVIAVVGRREAEEGKVALRRLGSNDQQVMTLDEAVAALTAEASAAGPAVKRTPLLPRGEGPGVGGSLRKDLDRGNGQQCGLTAGRPPPLTPPLKGEGKVEPWPSSATTPSTS